MTEHRAVTTKLAVAAVCFVLASASSCSASRGEKSNGAICGTIGQRITGDTVAELPAGLKKCVESCKMSVNCTAVNHWSRNGTCRLLRAMDSPELPHSVENMDNCFSVYVKPTCTVTTQPSDPLNYKFVLPELTAPFRVQFKVRVANGAIIALATGRQDHDIFCHITIGGWLNSKAAIRTGDMKVEKESGVEEHAVHEEENQLSAYEYRAFWIEYDNGLLKVGKGAGVRGEGAGSRAGACDGDPFMQWDVGTYTVAPSKVNIAISTWKTNSGEWVFEQLCE